MDLYKYKYMHYINLTGGKGEIPPTQWWYYPTIHRVVKQKCSSLLGSVPITAPRYDPLSLYLHN